MRGTGFLLLLLLLYIASETISFFSPHVYALEIAVSRTRVGHSHLPASTEDPQLARHSAEPSSRGVKDESLSVTVSGNSEFCEEDQHTPLDSTDQGMQTRWF